MSDQDDLALIYGVATDAERAMLDTLRISAGLIWRCPQCTLTMSGHTRWCDSCRCPRADLGIEPNRVAHDVAQLIDNFDGFRVDSHVPAADFLEAFCTDVLPHFQREVKP